MGKRQHWGTDLSFGGSSVRGNSEIDMVTSGGALFRAWQDSSLYAKGGFLYNTVGGKRIRNQGKMIVRYDRGLFGHWKWFLFNSNSYNESIRINHRMTNGIGPWYDLAWGPTRHGMSLAVTHEYERFLYGQIERAGRLSYRHLAHLPISQAAELKVDFFYVPKLDEFADAHIYTEVGLETTVWKDYLTLKVSWIDESDSRPQPGVKSRDTIWMTSLTVRLGK